MKIIIKFLSIVFIILLSLQTYLYWTRGIAGTSILTTVLFWLGLTLFSQFLIFKFYKLKNESELKLYKISLILFISVLSFEVTLRYALKKNLAYNEINGDFFYESFHREEYNRHYLYKANSIIDYSTSLFSYTRATNSLGIVNREVDILKPQEEIRIICFGDSFTEGVGSTSQEGTWPFLLQQLIAQKTKNTVNVINAGISGSDLAFQYILLKEIFLQYKPNLLVVAINPVDVDEFIVRGGLERFSDANLLQSNKAPKWEALYATSFIFRFFIHNIFNYTPLLLSPKQELIEREIATSKVLSTIEGFIELSKKEQFELLFVVHPDSGKDIYNKSQATAYLSQKIKERSDVAVFDLMEYFSTQSKITPKNYLDYFWEASFHHNQKGYYEVAKGIMNKINNDKLLAKYLIHKD